ncbi:MAG: transcription antitermination factor NusB [Eubacteriales bacterium]|nr:transcription antitermination factor NusB [Eubacteriales bacterium]
MSRKDTREELMKLFYMVDINDTIGDFDLEKYLEYLEIMVDVDYFRRTAENFRQHVLEIDRLIDIYSNDWKLNRIARIDFAILRLAVCEMEFDDSIPVSVSINEAVEISKKYSSSDAHKFINGILGNISRRSEV